MPTSWNIEELRSRSELDRYRAELVSAGKVPNTVQTYIDRADRFIRWLVGEYDPRQEGKGSRVRRRLGERTPFQATRSHPER